MALPAGVRSLPASSICERRRASRQTIEELQMPHFELALDQDGSARAIYKDGELIDGAISLESPNSIVQTYFVSAVRNLEAMTVGDEQDAHGKAVWKDKVCETGMDLEVGLYFTKKN